MIDAVETVVGQAHTWSLLGIVEFKRRKIVSRKSVLFVSSPNSLAKSGPGGQRERLCLSKKSDKVIKKQKFDEDIDIEDI